MAIGDIIVCLDVGASKVSSVVGQVNRFNEIEVIGYGLTESVGVKKGIIYDTTSVAEAIKKSVADAEEIAGLNIKSAYVNIKGMNVRIERVKVTGEVKNPDEGLVYSDITALYKKMQDEIETLPKEQIIDILPYEYIINDRIYKEEPVGAFCKEITLHGDVVIGRGEYIASIIETMQLADLKIDGLIIETLATSNVALMPEEKDLGVLMLDIGAGHTEISVYKKGNLEFYATLPVGSDHITNDIAIAFDVTTQEAEKLKMQYNLALKLMITNNHDIKLNTVQSNDKPTVIKCSDVVGVIESRVTEIFSIIKKILNETNLYKIVECAVITGQGLTNISGVEESAIMNLKINQVRICSPKLINVIKPQHATAYGMVKHIANLGASKRVNSEVEIITEPTLKDKIVEFFINAKQKFSFKKEEKEEINEIED